MHRRGGAGTDREPEVERERRPEVLVVTSDIARGEALASYLRERELAVDVKPRADAAFASLPLGWHPDAVLIDESAPPLGGRSFCRCARDSGHDFAILVLSDVDDPLEQVLCLEMGADDYLRADAPLRLVWTRLKAVLRRVLPAMRRREPDETMRRGALFLDRRRLRLEVRDRAVALTTAEFTCLWTLAENSGRVVSREALSAALGRPSGGPESRAVDTQIFRLRRKLSGVEPDANRIRSVRPAGYLLAP